MVSIAGTRTTHAVSMRLGAVVPVGWSARKRGEVQARWRQLEHNDISRESQISSEALSRRVRIRPCRFDRSRALTITDDKRPSTTTQLSR